MNFEKLKEVANSINDDQMFFLKLQTPGTKYGELIAVYPEDVKQKLEWVHNLYKESSDGTLQPTKAPVKIVDCFNRWNLLCSKHY